MNFKKKLEQTSKEALKAIAQSQNSHSLYQVKVHYLGRQGSMVQFMKELKKAPKKEKPLFGEIINQVKTSIEKHYSIRLQQLKQEEMSQNVLQSQMDLSLPGPEIPQGAFHPIEHVIKKTKHIFTQIGYTIAEGPLIETDWYNFSALNIPPDHPSRDIHDTFYLDSDRLLRTHTSPVQIRVLEKQSPPLAIIAPGPVFRRDQPDSSHSPYFHQVEGLLIDKKVSMSHLKGTLSYFLKKLHGSSAVVRFRPSFFPFTEPSAEYDCSCFLCQGRGCSLCKKSSWIEMGGCGLVHPQVLKMSGIAPNKWQGFAFGMGMDRLALLEYGIPDIRLFYENRMDFLQQFENDQGGFK